MVNMPISSNKSICSTWNTVDRAPQPFAFSSRRVAPIPGYFQTTNEGAPGPSHSGTGDATDFNPESVCDAAGQSPYVAQCSQIGWVPHPRCVLVFAARVGYPESARHP